MTYTCRLAGSAEAADIDDALEPQEAAVSFIRDLHTRGYLDVEHDDTFDVIVTDARDRTTKITVVPRWGITGWDTKGMSL